jgi:hypothetical protein
MSFALRSWPTSQKRDVGHPVLWLKDLESRGANEFVGILRFAQNDGVVDVSEAFYLDGVCGGCLFSSR